MDQGIINLIQLLQSRAAHQPDRLAYTFLLDGEEEEAHLTYGELERQARAIGTCLQQLNLQGQRVILLYPPSLEYIAAFWGCLYAGAVAVPAYPPRLNRKMQRLQAVVADAQPSAALTTEHILSRLQPLLKNIPALSALKWLVTEEIDISLAEHWRDPEIDGTTLAFLQYTSGSTAAPKGVMVSHGNLLHNEGFIKRTFNQTEDSVIVGWLPLYHDMGLIGTVLQPLYVGARCILMSPLAFLQKPLRWLQAISRYRATTSGGPNFAYELCVRKISPAQSSMLDLSCWDVAFNGAEPISAATLERFAAAFEPCGFRREAFYPCYGLAEATLLVSGDREGRPLAIKAVDKEALANGRVVKPSAEDKRGHLLVGCGAAVADQGVVIVNPLSMTRCAADEVGEVWARGPSVAAGYWNREEETASTFYAYLADSAVGPFLRTGDLGFVSSGELFIVGRLKDLIIIRGRNLYPHDIERTAEAAHVSLRPGGAVAFSIEAGEEELVLVLEADHRSTQDEYSEVVGLIRQAITEEHEVHPRAIVLVKAGTVPKTSSGKLQRGVAREMFSASKFEALYEWRGETRATESGVTLNIDPDVPVTAATHDIEMIVRFMCSQLGSRLGLEAPSIDTGRPLTRYGMDSLMAVELTHAVETQLGVMLPMSSFLEGLSIRELAAQAKELLDQPNTLLAPFTHVPPGQETLTLSYGQQALWFIHRMTPESAVYNVASAIRIRSALDATAMRRAFQDLVDRHATLRTTFLSVDSSPVQRVHEQMPVNFEEVDAAQWDEETVNEWIGTEAHRPFKLDEGTLLRVRLLELASGEHILAVVAHHIVVDFWSLAILLHEVGSLYEAEKRREPAKLTPLRAHYADHVRRQALMLEGREGERLWKYWSKQLEGTLPALNLPSDHPRPPVPTYRGASHAFSFDAALTLRLKSIGNEAGATLYMVLLAAFQALLYRYTGQEDFAVGSPAAGRDTEAFSDVVGYFVNPLVMRADVSGHPTFAELLERVRRTVLEAFAHQDYPFALVVQRLQPDRDASRSPLFQTMFVFQQAHLLKDEGFASLTLGEAGAQVRIGELVLESVALPHRVAQFDLKLSMAESNGALLSSIEYNTDLFDGATIKRMVEHFRTLLDGIAANPDRRVSDLPLLTEPERRQMLVEWNDTARAYNNEMMLHRLIEEQVELTPGAVAITSGGARLTYEELNRRSNQLAHRLRTHGVGPESLVGVLMGRSIELVVALLGILKAGAAYVPLDPNYPAARLAFMLDDTRLTVLLTQQRLLQDLPEHSATVICLDTESDASARASEENLSGGASSANLAYVIYTSGSTGRPKGVAITHRSAATFVLWAQGLFSPLELSGVLASTSVCFDLSVFELFVPLSVGGKVVLATNALELPTLAAAGEVTLVNTVPSAMAELVRAGDLPAAVRTVNLAGEALQNALAQRIYEAGNVERVLNLYGPSEDTTYSTWALIERGNERVPPIGRPVANTEIYIVDKEMNPVPVGVAGELYIGGDGLARGYLNRPDLTAERFVPDPFGGEAGTRLYQTGDLVRYLANGQVEYLGRLDQQVKLRGFRIELGEIEAALAEHEAVGECVVMARKDPQGDVRLVAYLVLESGNDKAASVWRRFLREKLPEHMIPSAFVVLDEMPRTTNEKVDRRALPEPRGERPELEEEFAAPRNEIEEVVAGIWAEVLGVERPGIQDNFFELGGHSLLAAQVISRIHEALKVELPLSLVFERPTIAGLAERLSAALAGGDESDLNPIERASREGSLPLSIVQQRLWFLDQLEPGNIAYNIPAAIRLSGRLDTETLERCMREIVHRHEALRTTFMTIDGRPVQVVAPPGPWSLLVTDLRGLAGDVREAEALRLAGEEARRPFDLTRGPLLRVRLLRLDEEEHIFLLTMHHIVSDGWSIGVFVRELTILYKAFSNGETSPLPDLPIQYADYSQWQRSQLAGELLDEQLRYWKRQLGGDLPVLELPSERLRLPKTTFNGATEPWAFPSELSEMIKDVGRKRGATLFMTLMTAYQILLHRYTGLNDVVVGTPVAGRARIEAEGLIGFFANTLVLRSDLSGDPTFEELLVRVREVTLAAHAHQSVPFEMLVEELQPARDLSHTPLYQVMLTMQNAPLPEMRLSGIKVSQVEIHNGTAKFDLIFFVRETENGLVGSWEYNTDCLDSATIKRMAGHFETLLKAVIADPRQRISELSLLTDPERRQLLDEWNDTKVIEPEGECLHHLFEAQVISAPHAIALVFEHEQWTYQELNRRANQVAHYLRSLGATSETLVTVMIDRSVDLIVALLGVLKSGGAYVPLDPAYPRERLRFMLEDTRASVLLTQVHLLDHVPATHDTKVICLDADWEEIAGASELDPPHSPSAQQLAYVIYTSGSTGRPKGVLVQHANVLRLLHATQDWFSFDEHDVWTLFHSFAFDFSVWEIWGALCYGGRLVIVPYMVSRSPDAFYQLLAGERVTVLNQTPSAFRQLVQTEEILAERAGPEATQQLALRLVIFGGEALAVEQLQPWFARHGDSSPQLVNMYGITETTVHVTYYPLRRADAERHGQGSLIGRPISDLSLYLLDLHGRPVPIGVSGELYVGGAGVARGYLHRPELTAERFVPDSFGHMPGARLYRSGDLARYLPDGNLEYLGRMDQQVKVRGFRIELGEIEAALCELLEVQQAVVVPSSRDGEEQRLVGYIVTHPGFAPTTSELRRQLKEQLPEYMIPSAFVRLDKISRTANGKIDRRSLPDPEDVPADLESIYLAPRTPVEEELTRIWSQLLVLNRVGVNDNFFDLGGHSLLATQIISRVRETFQVELPLRELFESPTVAGLAARVELASRGEGVIERLELLRQVKQGLTAPPILPVARDGALPLSFAQQRLWFLDQLAPGSSAYNIIGGMRLEGELDVAALEQALNEIVCRHEALRTTFTTVDGRLVQVITAGQPIALTLIDLRVLDEHRREERVRELAREELNRSFDLRQGPLLRVSLLRLRDDEHVALVTMHHIVSDGWSTAIFIKEFVALYETSRTGQPSVLAPLPIQYADYAHWQREWLQGEALESQLDYWKQKLEGALPALELPTDHPRSEEPTLRGEKLICKLPDELYKELRELSRREGVTLYMTLLAAFQMLLYRYTNQDDLIVGTAIAGRNRAEVEDLIGVFINMLVLRTDLSGNPTFRELMGRVREVTLEAYAHQEVPFERVVEELQPARPLTQSPLFQVAFGLQHAPLQTFTPSGLKMNSLTFDADISRYDLTLWMFESESELTASWTYSTDLFEAQTVARLQREFETVLRGVVENPETRLGALEVLSEGEKTLSALREREWEESNSKKLISVKRRSMMRLSDTAN